MDSSSHSTNHRPTCEPHRHCGWCLLCCKQRVPIVGSALWEALLCLMGHCPSLPFLERSIGKTEPNTDHRHCLVCSSRFHLFVALGQDQSLCLRQSQCQQLQWPRRCLLDPIYILVCAYIENAQWDIPNPLNPKNPVNQAVMVIPCPRLAFSE